ncbi:OmpA family protein [Rhizobium sp. CFBP 8762]|uniref:OmpA family protein n=1 Tax=Rhizobium sp. CFBP 8762 TaxID=2775279 RepID=UPI00177B9D43|nr:OmpA family protein [Rhizobium sp. CFBP 8762]MBD8555845.1 OmpA family protein [Rhizobium sp. CFBP 8762]
MTLRSKLLGTVAMPVLTVALIAQPILAAAQTRSFEVAQAEEAAPQAEPAQQDDGAAEAQAEEERRRQEQQASEAQAAAQQKADDEAARAAQAEAAEQQRAADEAAAAQAAAEKQAAKEAAKAEADAEQQRAAQAEAEAQAKAEQQAADEAQKAADEAQAQQKQADEAAKAAAEAQAQADQQAVSKKAAKEAEKAAEDQAAQSRADEETKAAAERQAEEERAAKKAASAAEKAAEPEAVTPQEQKAVDDNAAAPQGEEQTAEPQTAPVPTPSPEAPAQEQVPATGEAPVPEPAPGEPAAPADQAAQPAPVQPIVEQQTEAEKQTIAQDPAKTTETVVLPVENGAAVLDSDKDADNARGAEGRRERQEQRAQEKAAPPPKTDADAQVTIKPAEAKAISANVQEGLTEKGQRLEAAPVFAVPAQAGGTVINNNTVNNTTTNNTVNNNTVTNNNVTNTTVNTVVVQSQVDNRTVLKVDDRLIVRGDDRPRLRRDSDDSFYEELPRGRTRETIVKPDGSRIVTVYDRYGDTVQRSRIDRRGREYLLTYAPEMEDREPSYYRDPGYDLPPMRLTVPVRDYIIDTSSSNDRDYYEFLAEPPVERVERVYSIDEVKYSARLRDKVRRIDLDTITFATGSAEVPLQQAKTLRKVGEAINEVLKKDPGETFLIEGHTDAVGSDQSNLVLSDQRAESVAVLLTEVYGIPAENLVTQGYGERFLKVRTQTAEQANRRVTIRRVTALVRPAQK